MNSSRAPRMGGDSAPRGADVRDPRGTDVRDSRDADVRDPGDADLAGSDPKDTDPKDTDPKDTDPRDREIASALRRGTTRLGTRMRAERPPGALSGNKIGVLSHLHRNGLSTPGAVAAAAFQRPQSLTRVFADLEADGFVVRTRSERDGRQVLLGLTEAGREALYDDMRSRDTWLVGALGALTGTEREVLRLAGALMERLAEQR